MPCVPSKTFLELSLWHTRSCTQRLECLVCATISKVVVLCGETWARPTGPDEKGPGPCMWMYSEPICTSFWLLNPSKTSLVFVLLKARGRWNSMKLLHACMQHRWLGG